MQFFQFANENKQDNFYDFTLDKVHLILILFYYKTSILTSFQREPTRESNREKAKRAAANSSTT